MENADAPCESPTQTQSPGPKNQVAKEATRRFLVRGYQAVGLREISTKSVAGGAAGDALNKAVGPVQKAMDDAKEAVGQ